MNLFKQTIVGTAVTLSLFATPVVGEGCQPKWCEASTLSKVETLICSDVTLKAADIFMSNLYIELMSFKGKEGHEGMWYREVESNQKDWIIERNKAENKAQVLDAYITRTQSLNAVLQGHLK